MTHKDPKEESHHKTTCPFYKEDDTGVLHSCEICKPISTTKGDWRKDETFVGLLWDLSQDDRTSLVAFIESILSAKEREIVEKIDSEIEVGDNLFAAGDVVKAFIRGMRSGLETAKAIIQGK